jgi:hypothetical protein
MRRFRLPLHSHPHQVRPPLYGAWGQQQLLTLQYGLLSIALNHPCMPSAALRYETGGVECMDWHIAEGGNMVLYASNVPRIKAN